MKMNRLGPEFCFIRLERIVAILRTATIAILWDMTAWRVLQSVRHRAFHRRAEKLPLLVRRASCYDSILDLDRVRYSTNIYFHLYSDTVSFRSVERGQV